MGKRYLIDTNAVLGFMGHKMTGMAKVFMSSIIDEEFNLSVINKIELLGFSTVEQDLIDFVDYSTIYSLDENIVDKTLELRRLHKIKLSDAVIAATALENNFILVSRNTKDFKNIAGLKVINPFDL